MQGRKHSLSSSEWQASVRSVKLRSATLCTGVFLFYIKRHLMSGNEFACSLGSSSAKIAWVWTRKTRWKTLANNARRYSSRCVRALRVFLQQTYCQAGLLMPHFMFKWNQNEVQQSHYIQNRFHGTVGVHLWSVFKPVVQNTNIVCCCYSDNRKVSSQNIKVHSKVVLHVHKGLFEQFQLN